MSLPVTAVRRPLPKMCPLDILDADAIIGFSRDHDIDLVVVGPEAPLVAKALPKRFAMPALPCSAPIPRVRRLRAARASRRSS